MSDIFYASIFFPPTLRGDSVIESADLRVERYTRNCLRITDQNAKELTPSSLRIEKDSYIKVWERDDGVFEYLDQYTQAPYKGAVNPKNNTPLGGYFIQFMILFAAIVFWLSAIVHFSTYLISGEFISKMDNVGLLHILIFPPFIAAIVLAKKWGGGSDDDDGQDRIDRHAPKWMKLLCGVCFAYAFINFILCMVLNASGGPGIDKEGKYVIKSHGRTLKVVSKKEYENAQAIVTRAFSGHWMLFSSAAVMMLTGIAEVRRRKIAGDQLEPNENGDPDIEQEPETVSNEESVVARAMRGELDLNEETRKCNAALKKAKRMAYKSSQMKNSSGFPIISNATPKKNDPNEVAKICDATQENKLYDPISYEEPFVSRPQAFRAIAAYILSVIAIIADVPFLTAILAPFLCYVGIKSLRRLFERSRRKNEQFRSTCGCLSVVPNFFLAGVFAKSLGKLVCVAIYADFTQALMGTVEFVTNQAGPYTLTNGATVDMTTYGIISFAAFVFTIIFLAGLTGLMEYAGRGLKL